MGLQWGLEALWTASLKVGCGRQVWAQQLGALDLAQVEL